LRVQTPISIKVLALWLQICQSTSEKRIKRFLSQNYRIYSRKKRILLKMRIIPTY